ncbi:MAG: peptidoglycan DD-metalloendopeptidase family protein [Paludibacteraceae bacterium]|nr:peptidoglycan DD-metalloendopeptidase family protein [Paludibacteraceae bacterium]
MKRIFVILTCLVIVLSAGAQSVEELQKRKARALKNLEATSNLITENKANTQKTMTKINLLQAEIKERKVVINSLNAEVNEINRQISALRTEIATQQKQLDALKREYAALMYHRYYKKGQWDNLMFVLSAGNVAQSYRRYRYIQQYAEYCTIKGEEIVKVQAELDVKMAEIEKVRAARVEVLNERQRESAKLQGEKNKQDKLVKSLKKKQKELSKQLKKQQQIANQLNAQIEKKIAAEASKSGKKGSKGTTEYALTKEEKLVSGNFEKNQHRLPWPVEKGLVVGAYGIQPHPVLEHVTTNNKGIYIQCPKGSKARAVFEGEVTQCFSIPGSNNVVIVKHGLYRTVYANLVSLNVKIGDKVTAKQVVGTIYSDAEEDNKTVLYFQVWKDKTTQNPEIWLAK